MFFVLIPQFQICKVQVSRRSGGRGTTFLLLEEIQSACAAKKLRLEITFLAAELTFLAAELTFLAAQHFENFLGGKRLGLGPLTS